MVLDPQKDWSSPANVTWSWCPRMHPDADIDDASWGLPNDARLRRDNSTEQRYVLISDSNGLLASVPYPRGGPVAWSVNAGAAANPHGIERLPDGNVAAAASTGGWIRLYAARQGQHCAECAEDALPGAHEVLWDASRQTLWAVGMDALIEYAVGGTRAAPTLTRLAVHDLPTSGGHDLQPVGGEPKMLWVTTVAGVYWFDPASGEFTRADHPRAADLHRVDVKSVATDAASGTVLQTTPKPGNLSTWCTDQVDLFIGAGAPVSRILPGAQIYRARWFHESSN
jgi:hypothetical protein